MQIKLKLISKINKYLNIAHALTCKNILYFLNIHTLSHAKKNLTEYGRILDLAELLKCVITKIFKLMRCSTILQNSIYLLKLLKYSITFKLKYSTIKKLYY